MKSTVRFGAGVAMAMALVLSAVACDNGNSTNGVLIQSDGGGGGGTDGQPMGDATTTPDTSIGSDTGTTGGDTQGADSGSADTTSDDVAAPDATTADAGASDTNVADAAVQDVAGEDSAAQDIASADGTGEDSTGEDITGEDSTGEDITGEDITGEDVAGPDATAGDDTGGCAAQCIGKGCGPDGCEGTCGTCGASEECTDSGVCVPTTCVPLCEGKACGPDGCGAVCGQCDAGFACTLDQKCVKIACVPECTGKQCGPDGCGGECGQCAAGTACTLDQKCVQIACVPDCTDKQCGTDGCGGSCGTCAGDTMCAAAGTCVAPDALLSCATYDLCIGDCADNDQPCFDACFANASNLAVNVHSAVTQCATDMGCYDEPLPEGFMACLFASCGLEYDACFPAGTGSCSELFDCISPCGGDMSCESACMGASSQEGLDTADAVMTCMSTKGCYDKPTPEEVQACLETDCAAALIACTNTDFLSCSALFDCAKPCGADSGCNDSCVVAASPDALAQAGALVSCQDAANCTGTADQFSQCTHTSCQAEVAACYPGGYADCVDYFTCVNTCIDGACVAACAQESTPTTVGDGMALIDCLDAAGCYSQPTQEDFVLCAESQCAPALTTCGFGLTP